MDALNALGPIRLHRARGLGWLGYGLVGAVAFPLVLNVFFSARESLFLAALLISAVRLVIGERRLITVTDQVHSVLVVRKQLEHEYGSPGELIIHPSVRRGSRPKKRARHR